MQGLFSKVVWHLLPDLFLEAPTSSTRICDNDTGLVLSYSGSGSRHLHLHISSLCHSLSLPPLTSCDSLIWPSPPTSSGPPRSQQVLKTVSTEPLTPVITETVYLLFFWSKTPHHLRLSPYAPYNSTQPCTTLTSPDAGSPLHTSAVNLHDRISNPLSDRLIHSTVTTVSYSSFIIVF